MSNRHEWLMRFTDDELEAIYTAIEIAPPRAEYEARWESVIEKVCADRIGPGARPMGAVDPLGGASRGVGRCTCPCGKGTDPACPVHP